MLSYYHFVYDISSALSYLHPDVKPVNVIFSQLDDLVIYQLEKAHVELSQCDVCLYLRTLVYFDRRYDESSQVLNAV